MTPWPTKSHQTVQIDIDLYNQFKELAEERNDSPAKLINDALREWLYQKKRRDDEDNYYRTH